MWLEEMAWLWLPIAAAFVAWTIWQTTRTRREVESLSKRVAKLEAAGKEHAKDLDAA